ncbi:MAG TPA: serine protease [Planctomycetaceae bacterium]|nr:serine protease [Planctomycetaceae bacterium]
MSCRSFGRFVAAAALVAAGGIDPSQTLAQAYRLRVVSAECTPHGCRLAAAHCTAVAIGRHKPSREILLTAGHCVGGNVRSVAVEIDGGWRPAVVLAVSRQNGRDLAVLGIETAGRNLRCAALAERAAEAGEPVTLASFPGGGPLERRAGRVAAHRYRDVELVVDVPTRPGESGGAILDGEGRLTGIISATGPLPSPDHTLAAGASVIRAFLGETFRAGVPRCEEAAPFASPPDAGSSGHGPPDAGAPAANAPPGLAADCCRPELDARLTAMSDAIEQLRGRIARLEQRPIPVQVLSPDGRIVDERRVLPGEPIQLRLVPSHARSR